MVFLSDLEAAMRGAGILALNIHRSGAGFRVHVRQSEATGFTCAQKEHASLADALREHLMAKDDDGLLV